MLQVCMRHSPREMCVHCCGSGALWQRPREVVWRGSSASITVRAVRSRVRLGGSRPRMVAMSQLARLRNEQAFHDRQARQRVADLAGRALAFADDEYLDHASWIRPALARLG